MKKKIAAIVLAAVLLVSFSITTMAAPYENYTITESGAYKEPQAYVPDRVINTSSIGLNQLSGLALSGPKDLVQFRFNGWVIVTDTGNNRIVVLDESMRNVQQLLVSWAPEEDKIESAAGKYTDLLVQIAQEKGYTLSKDEITINKGIIAAKLRLTIQTIRESLRSTASKDKKKWDALVIEITDLLLAKMDPNTLKTSAADYPFKTNPNGAIKSYQEMLANTFESLHGGAKEEIKALETKYGFQATDTSASATTGTTTGTTTDTTGTTTDTTGTTTDTTGTTTDTTGTTTGGTTGSETKTNSSEYGFSSPEGMFLYEDDVAKQYYLYVCDPGNFRIERFVFNTEKGQFEYDTQYSSVQLPDSTVKFVPTKIVVDNAKRMFVIVKNVSEGIVELSSDGTFIKYYGATKTKVSLSTLFARLFSATAKSGTVQNLSTVYSNITQDSKGFVYGTIATMTAADLRSHFSSATEIGAALRKLNAAGADVLKRQGIEPPSGINGNGVDRSSYSYIVDATVSKNGLASILDDYQGRVFTYTSYGELLFVFGGRGQRTVAQEAVETTTQSGYTAGTSMAPVAIQLLNDDETYAILDGDGAAITTFVPTEYGLLLREAVNAHEERRYDDAKAAWTKVLSMSSNSTLAYSGIGKVIYMEASQSIDEEKQKTLFLEAANYFKKAYDQPNYANAFYQYRDLVLSKVMPYMMTGVIVVVIAGIAWGSYRKFKKFVRTGGKADE